MPNMRYSVTWRKENTCVIISLERLFSVVKVRLTLTIMCIFLKNNPNLHTLFAPMTYFHSLGYTLCVLNGIFAIEIDICFSFTNAVFHNFYLYPHHHHFTFNSSLFTRASYKVYNSRSFHRSSFT